MPIAKDAVNIYIYFLLPTYSPSNYYFGTFSSLKSRSNSNALKESEDIRGDD